jgi:hypothetical protein
MMMSAYNLVKENKIPYYKPHKKLLFKLDEIENMINAGRVPAKFEISDLAIKDKLLQRVEANRKY